MQSDYANLSNRQTFQKAFMSKDASNHSDDNVRQQTVADFKKAVNMISAQLEKWLDSDDSKRVGQKLDGGESVGHQSGRRIIELQHRKAQNLSEDDLVHMRKVVGYVHRHLPQGPSKSDWRYSLINCAGNLVLQGGVKSTDGEAVLAFSAVSAAVRCTAGQQRWLRHRNFRQSSWATKARRPIASFGYPDNSSSVSSGWTRL